MVLVFVVLVVFCAIWAIFLNKRSNKLPKAPERKPLKTHDSIRHNNIMPNNDGESKIAHEITNLETNENYTDYRMFPTLEEAKESSAAVDFQETQMQDLRRAR